MACPFFMPMGLLKPLEWAHEPRLPLGDAQRGVCRSQPGEVIEPPEAAQRDQCNCGYARGSCDRFPEASADAVRFSITGDRNGRIQLIYVFEKDHAPAEHGAIEYGVADGRMTPGGSELLYAQARAFIESYLRRTA